MCDVHDVQFFNVAVQLDHPALECSCHLRLNMRSDAEIYAALEAARGAAGSINEVEAKSQAAKKWLSDQLARGLLLARKEDRDARPASMGGAMEQTVNHVNIKKQIKALLKPIGFEDWSRVETLAWDTSSIVILPDSRIVCGSNGYTVKIFKERTDGSGGWANTANLEGPGCPNRVAALPDGRIVSSSEDDDVAVEVWTQGDDGDWDNTATLAGPDGHTWRVTSVAALPDGRIVSSSEREIKVWTQGEGGWDCTATLTRNSAAWAQPFPSTVNVVAVLPDGRIVSGSEDMTVKVWTERAGLPSGWDCTAILTEHISEVISVAALSDGRIVSGGGGHDDIITNGADGIPIPGNTRMMKVWTEREGLPSGWDCTATLRHTMSVMSVAGLPDGRIVSGSNDEVKVWTQGEDGDWDCTATLTGHTWGVFSVAALPDGRIVSGAGDNMVKIWG